MNVKEKLQELTWVMRDFVCKWVAKAAGNGEVVKRASRADGWYAFPSGGEVVGGFEPTMAVAWKPYEGDGEGGCAFLFKRLGSNNEYSKSINYLTTDELFGIYNYVKNGVYSINFQEWI